jgi:DNA-binding Lrp family transcriptional regulator
VTQLSNIDLKILEVLQREGDITNVRLAEQVGLSPSPCLQRVRRLREQGFISDVLTIVNLKKLSPFVAVFCRIRLSEQTAQRYSIFERAIMKIPEIVECSLVSGEYDYHLRIVARDLDHFNDVVTMIMDMNIGIRNYTTLVEIKPVKRAREMPLRSLLTPPNDSD